MKYFSRFIYSDLPSHNSILEIIALIALPIIQRWRCQKRIYQINAVKEKRGTQRYINQRRAIRVSFLLKMKQKENKQYHH